MEKSDIEFYVWAEKIADELKDKKARKHVVHGMWTPSGFFHIGNSRAELLVPHFVDKSLKNIGLKSEQNLIFDDFDDFDKIPEGLDAKKEDFEQYLGKPLREVPSPKEGYESWAHFFEKDILTALDKFGVKPNIISSYDSYKKGLYDKAIKIVLNKAEEVRKIWNDVTNGDKPKGWIPVMPICENCGKSATTKVVSWDGNELEYLCTQPRPYAEGCRHRGKLKPGKGNVKLPWRVHWAAGWNIYGTTFESGGKDHFSAGGSVETSQTFCREIFKSEPPLQKLTEFLLVDNTKLSGSSGNVISLHNWMEFAEPELLRFMMISYKPQTVINFDLHSNKFFLLADRYDESERAYFGEDDKENKRKEQLNRYYALSQIKEIQDKLPVQLNYSIAAMITQVFPEKPLSELVSILSSRGWIHRKTLTKFDKDRLLKRLELAKNWVDKFAPEDAKFTVQEEIPKNLKLGSKEKEALSLVVKALKDKKWNEKSLFEEFYNICKKVGIKNTDFFKAAYNVLLNKDRGPKLAPFILTLGKEKVVDLFQKI
jgi:lysyl-tRNA synthetase, class I